MKLKELTSYSKKFNRFFEELQVLISSKNHNPKCH